jgi:hypothetical protein
VGVAVLIVQLDQLVFVEASEVLALQTGVKEVLA